MRAGMQPYLAFPGAQSAHGAADLRIRNRSQDEVHEITILHSFGLSRDDVARFAQNSSPPSRTGPTRVESDHRG